jgi:hypothetical protein
MRPYAIGKVFGSLETKGISCIWMRSIAKEKADSKGEVVSKGKK